MKNTPILCFVTAFATVTVKLLSFLIAGYLMYQFLMECIGESEKLVVFRDDKLMPVDPQSMLLITKKMFCKNSSMNQQFRHTPSAHGSLIQWKAWSTVHNAGLYPCHYTPVQVIHEEAFCRFTLYADIENASFLKKILWADESKFDQDGILVHGSQTPIASRRKSSSDISSAASGGSNLPSDEPASEASTSRTNRSQDDSDNSQSKQDTSQTTESTHDTSNSSKPKVPPIFVTLDIDSPPQRKGFFRNFLRRKSNSLESFFPANTQTENKEDGKKEIKHTNKHSPIIKKLKSIFTNLRNSDRFRWVNAQPISTSQGDLVTHINQSAQEYLQPTCERADIPRKLLLPERRRSATKLAELKKARPVKNKNESNGSSSSPQTRKFVSLRGESLVRTATKPHSTTPSPTPPSPTPPSPTPPSPTPPSPRHKSPSPPSPSPQDPELEQTAHSFYITNAETSENSVTTPNSTQFRTVYFKLKQLNGQSSSNSHHSDRHVRNEYNIKKVSVDALNTHRIIHFEPPEPPASKETVNNYTDTYERFEKTHNHKLSDRHHHKQKNKVTKLDFGCEDSTEYEIALNTLEINTLERVSTSPLEQPNYYECTYEPQPGTSREYPPDRLVNTKVRIKKESIKDRPVSEDSSVSEKQEPRNQGHQNQRKPIPLRLEALKSKSKYNRQHQDTSPEQTSHSDPILRPKQLVGVSKQTAHNTFWRRRTYDNLYLDSPPDSDVDSDNILFHEFLLEDNNYREKGPSYQRPTLNSEYLEPRDYGYRCQENVTVYPDTRYLERTISSNSEHRDNSGTRRSSGECYRAGMCSLEEHERKVIIEFCHLLEKSKQLFNGLRELPQYGHKQWHSYFGRTFDVYTKLWKFQQQHRTVLNNKYGLKRWQIGEIASKIGQLYYHFYIRTSEIAYLYEAYSFYYAIRGRSYYTKASKEDKCELMVKKLRYYARFIVVCLLLKKIKLVRDLIKELDRQIIEYGKTYDPDDQVEWTVVVDEVKAFVQAEPMVVVIDPDNYPVIVPQRLSIQSMPPVERSPSMTLSLQDVIIVGSSSYQVKFSELTMDMFRMLQTLEREPNNDIQHMYDESPRQRFNLTPTALNNKGYNLEPGAPHSDNPHKYLLFKPTTNQILVYLASSINDLPPNGALLVYMSAEGQIGTPSKHIEDGYDIGGLITTSKSDVHRDTNKDQKGAQAKYRDVNSFHPGDLFPYTRRPLFVIIDSDNSYVFQTIPRHFGQPLIILMSPLELPPSLNVSTSDRRQHGNLFTLFLHSPVKAFCYCCDIHTLSLTTWEKAITLIDSFMIEASLTVTRSRIDPQYISFMGDDFLRVLTLRYIFCEVVLRAHRAFRTRAQLPRSSPAIPDDVLEHPTLARIVQELAALLQVRAHFQESPSGVGSQSKE